MTKKQLKIKVVHANEIAIVCLSGKFYLGNVQEVEQIWEEEVQKSPKVIAIDCQELEFIDSSAIGTLVKFLNNTAEDKIQMIFVDVNSSVVSVFNRAKLNRVFKIMDREEFESEFFD